MLCTLGAASTRSIEHRWALSLEWLAKVAREATVLVLAVGAAVPALILGLDRENLAHLNRELVLVLGFVRIQGLEVRRFGQRVVDMRLA